MQGDRIDSPPEGRQAGKAGASGLVTPHGLKWHGRLAAATIFAISRLLMLSWRCRFKADSAILARKDDSPAIFCIWHNRLALCMVAYHQWVRPNHPAQGLAAL